MQPGDDSVLQIAKKCIFTQKIAKKWIFEGWTKKIFSIKGQICFQHKKYVKEIKFQNFLAIFTLHYLMLPDYKTKSAKFCLSVLAWKSKFA